MSHTAPRNADALVSLWLDFLWAEGLQELVYPHIFRLLESYSFNGHVTSNEAKEKDALKGANTFLYESTRQVRRRVVNGQE